MNRNPFGRACRGWHASRSSQPCTQRWRATTAPTAAPTAAAAPRAHRPVRRPARRPARRRARRPPRASRGTFTIGYSNGGGVGNGFREEQVCTAKARPRRSAARSRSLDVIHRNTDAAGQLADLRTLISQNVNAIVFNPNDADALNPALAEAHAAGIPTVSVDAYVTDPNTWNLYNNQVKYA